MHEASKKPPNPYLGKKNLIFEPILYKFITTKIWQQVCKKDPELPVQHDYLRDLLSLGPYHFVDESGAGLNETPLDECKVEEKRVVRELDAKELSGCASNRPRLRCA